MRIVSNGRSLIITHNQAAKPKANASLLDSREDRNIQGSEESIHRPEGTTNQTF